MTVKTQDKTLSVAVLARDPLVRQGIVGYLRVSPGIRLMTLDAVEHADVVLVIDGEVGEGTLSAMKCVAEKVPGRDARFVIVCDAIRESQLLRALDWGMVSVLLRQETDYDRIASALADARHGRIEVPRDAGGWLESRLRAVQRDLLAAQGLNSAGLYDREVDVLRLLADGMDNTEIASRLNYSERTVRNIVQGVLSRLKLRNRVQAVAYAIRTGAIEPLSAVFAEEVGDAGA